MKILLFTGFYLPGFKGGGPIRTIANLVERLGDQFEFWIVTADRDLGDDQTYEQVNTNQWNKVGNAHVFYATPSMQSFSALIRIIRQTPHDILYLNSFFNPKFTICPLLARWLRLVPNKILVIAPRGEFSSGALALKARKKIFFMMTSRLIGLYKGAIWQASTQNEAEDIRRNLGWNVAIRIAVNIAQPRDTIELTSRQTGMPLRTVFISRISPKKNLLGAIEILQHVRQQVVFDVYGPVEDESYWAACQKAAQLLPPHVTFNYRGALHPDEVPATLARYDLFFLPTLGENFGHVIAEALSAGLPVLISDTTPWRGLADQSLGWDVPLDQPGQFAACIEACCHKPAAEYDAWRKAIRAWAVANIGNQDAIEQNRQLFMNLK